jgi:hypothetical protein
VSLVARFEARSKMAARRMLIDEDSQRAWNDRVRAEGLAAAPSKEQHRC